jgi:hypothetical protein
MAVNNKTQKGGSCGMGGVCAIQAGGMKKRTHKTRKQRAGGCGCAGSTATNTTTKQFGGMKKRTSKTRKQRSDRCSSCGWVRGKKLGKKRL